MIWRWAIDILLLLLSVWVANLAVFNWWAGSGPPTPNHDIYSFRGNLFIVLACLFFVGFFILLIMNIKKMMGK